MNKFRYEQIQIKFDLKEVSLSGWWCEMPLLCIFFGIAWLNRDYIRIHWQCQAIHTSIAMFNLICLRNEHLFYLSF